MLEENLALVQERDAWFKGAHAIAVAVAEKRALASALRLHTHQQAWHGLADRFGHGLQDTCQQQLQDLRDGVDEWRRRMAEWLKELSQRDRVAQKAVVSLRVMPG